jgi:hypothetical protein
MTISTTAVPMATPLNLMASPYVLTSQRGIYLQLKASPFRAGRRSESRFGELGVSEDRYGDLLLRADEECPHFLEKLQKLIYSSNMQETIS